MLCSRKTLAVLTLIVAFLIGLCSQAAAIDKSSKLVGDRSVLTKRRTLAYSLPDDHRRSSTGIDANKLSLSVPSYASSSDGSPGVTIGWTYWEFQQNCSMGRMIGTGPHSGETGPTVVHFGWTHLPDSAFEARTYMYNAYKSGEATLAGAYRLHDPDNQYSGYVNVDVTPDNRALVGGHCDEKGPAPYMPQIHFDACSACRLFDAYVRLPDSLGDYEQEIGNEQTWPKFFFQFGSDTVLHIVSQCNTDNQTYHQTIMYFRKVGYEGTPTGWDYPPYCVDSVPITAHDITGERLGDRVCMAWFANLPYQEPTCDTCSGVSLYTGTNLGLMDNDLYYQISNDQGVTWEPRVNLTTCPLGASCDKPYADLSMLFDQSNVLHLVWTACPWPADPCLGEVAPCFEDLFIPEAGKLLHWSEAVPYIQVIASHVQDPIEECSPPAFALRVAKPTVSECDNKLYALWTQFNSIPDGVLDDCAEWGYVLPWSYGAANGELWVAGSADGGMTWSNQYNLTQSYTPHCDPSTGSDCQSDYWASMNRYGRQLQAGEDWSMAVIVDPTGFASTDYYLDIQYVNDLEAGASIYGDEGSWTNNPIKWFRMPCFEPQPCGPTCPLAYPMNITFPDYSTGPGIETPAPLKIYNYNCFAVDYEYSIEEDNGPSGWLGVSNLSGTVSAGPGTVEVDTIILNKDGVLTDYGWYYGRVNIEYTYLGAPLLEGSCDWSIEVVLLVEDERPPPVYDVVNTSCLALRVSSYGNMGNDGEGQVNMDYYPEDCDSTARIYLYDGSPFVGRLIGDDTVFNSAVWQVNQYDEEGLRSWGGHTDAEHCAMLNAEVFESGTFSTQDSAVGIERIWVAPADDCEFIIEHTRVWSYDGEAHEDLLLGEVIDWDVPWDYLADDELNARACINTSGIDGPRGMIYQQGYDAHGAGSDTGYPYNCQYNDERFAGIAFVESYMNGTFRSGAPFGGFIGENDVLVYPAVRGFFPGLFYQEAILSGLRGTDSTEDIHSAMTFEASLDLGTDDVYEVVTVLATIRQGTLADLQAAVDAGQAWYAARGGMAMFADDDDDGQIDVCGCCCQLVGDFQHDGDRDPLDVVSLVNWLWRGGAGPECLVEADINCDCSVDPQDAIIYLYWMWHGWPWPGCECAAVCACP